MDVVYANFSIVMFAGNVLMQIGLARYVFRDSLLKATLFSLLVMAVCLIFVEAWYVTRAGFSFADAAGHVFLHLITYVSLGYCYIHFVNLGETARRIRLLRELDEAPQGLSLEQLLQRYNAREIVDRRVERLLTNKQIRLEGGRYYSQRPFMIRTARCMVAFKKFLLGKSSEFD